jgi:hypothetical protein
MNTELNQAYLDSFDEEETEEKMNIATVEEHAKKFVKEHPDFADEVNDLIQLCKDEIEEGESVEHECELCIISIDQLIESV